MDNGQTNWRFSDGITTDGIQLQLRSESGEWQGATETSQQDYYRCVDTGAKCEERGRKVGKETTEREKFSITECDTKCTEHDHISGMFGYFCTRCGESDLGSLNEH